MLHVQDGMHRLDLTGRYLYKVDGRYLVVTDSANVDVMATTKDATFPLFSNGSQDEELTSYIIEHRGYLVLNNTCNVKILRTDEYDKFYARRLQHEGVTPSNSGNDSPQ